MRQRGKSVREESENGVRLRGWRKRRARTRTLASFRTNVIPRPGYDGAEHT